MEQDNTPTEEQQQEQQPRPRKNILSVFIPKGDYFFTPIIININIAVYLVMIISGVDPMFPDSNAVLSWGAGFRPLTMNGEPWRLLTSTFLHFGLIHIAVNMLSLYNIGRMLEPFIGRWRFLVVYLCAGIGGSVISNWWHEAGVSAGASGAIVGIMGVLGSLVAMPNLVRKEVRMSLLKSIGQSLALLVIIGMNGFVDNAGHFGGLGIGAICGFLIYFEVKAGYQKNIHRYYMLLLSVIVTLGICIYFWTITPKPDYVDFDKHINGMLGRFDRQDQFAINNINKSQSIEMTEGEIEEEIVAPYRKCIQIGDSLMNIKDLSDIGKKMVYQLEKYAEYRYSQGQFIKNFAVKKDSAFVDSIFIYEKYAEKMKEEINKTMQKASEENK